MGSIPTGVGEPTLLPECRTSNQIYPHRCGGTSTILLTSIGFRGLSPQVWGNRQHLEGVVVGLGSIPTGVGEPFVRARQCVMSQVYPHRCGGTMATASNTNIVQGLSPQVWGNHFPLNRNITTTGSIPTGVGEPSKRKSCCMRKQVYPHRCGGTMNSAVF